MWEGGACARAPPCIVEKTGREAEGDEHDWGRKEREAEKGWPSANWDHMSVWALLVGFVDGVVRQIHSPS